MQMQSWHSYNARRNYYAFACSNRWKYNLFSNSDLMSLSATIFFVTGRYFYFSIIVYWLLRSYAFHPMRRTGTMYIIQHRNKNTNETTFYDKTS